ncbi:MAG TPA: 50S ribosomal protein L7Ae [Candidatus Lokiarchaeia archaeon]|nr:50S ribosomal protein L7Ae [Candidatus Lokiarchaeia archaeon]
MSYVTNKAPKETQTEALEILAEVLKSGGKVRKGTNETTKAIERKQAKLVFIAGNVNPPEIVYYLPPLCDEKQVPYIFIDDKKDLGTALGLEKISSAAAAIVEEGKLKDRVATIVERLSKLAE